MFRSWWSVKKTWRTSTRTETESMGYCMPNCQTLQTLSTSAFEKKSKAAVFAKIKTEGIHTKMIENNRYEESALWNWWSKNVPSVISVYIYICAYNSFHPKPQRKFWGTSGSRQPKHVQAVVNLRQTMDKDKSSVKYVRSGPLAQAGFIGVHRDSMVMKTGLKCETDLWNFAFETYLEIFTKKRNDLLGSLSILPKGSQRNSPKSPTKWTNWSSFGSVIGNM